jgi:hypothetical protein
LPVGRNTNILRPQRQSSKPPSTSLLLNFQELPLPAATAAATASAQTVPICSWLRTNYPQGVSRAINPAKYQTEKIIYLYSLIRTKNIAHSVGAPYLHHPVLSCVAGGDVGCRPPPCWLLLPHPPPEHPPFTCKQREEGRKREIDCAVLLPARLPACRPPA